MIPLLSISQGGYPKIILVNNDTIVAFTPKQARVLDYYRIDLKETKEKEEFFKNKALECEKIKEEYSKYSDKLLKENNMFRDLDTLKTIEINKISEDLKKSIKSNERKKSIIKFLGAGFVTVSLTLIGVLVFN